ncbi:hypothetical protein TNIN_119251 [Trichonephila inaurata madagascariensis]|uniref:Uncharacterized protein n=1 Tax=Trichonephila inaurata madagascariensis TaxID=2747483 RepID=A0A8X6XAR0_9ARAC|nr:hypothetical protein TNIN_119251 [Trichonephila inaurata madagascariensis]
MLHTSISPIVLWSILLFVYSSIVEYSALKFSPENSEFARLVHFYDLLQLHTVYTPRRTNVVQNTLVGVMEKIIEAKFRYEMVIYEEKDYRFVLKVEEVLYSELILFSTFSKIWVVWVDGFRTESCHEECSVKFASGCR